MFLLFAKVREESGGGGGGYLRGELVCHYGPVSGYLFGGGGAYLRGELV